MNDIAGNPKNLTLNVVFRKHEDTIVAECVEIPGCISQGDTQEEAARNIHTAINSCLSVIMEDCIRAASSSVQ